LLTLSALRRIPARWRRADPQALWSRYNLSGRTTALYGDLNALSAALECAGGKVLTEIGSQGQKFRTYLYANGALLAWQQVTYFNGSVYYQGPVWEHRDASHASYRLTGPTSSMVPDPGW